MGRRRTDVPQLMREVFHSTPLGPLSASDEEILDAVLVAVAVRQNLKRVARHSLFSLLAQHLGSSEATSACLTYELLHGVNGVKGKTIAWGASGFGASDSLLIYPNDMKLAAAFLLSRVNWRRLESAYSEAVRAFRAIASSGSTSGRRGVGRSRSDAGDSQEPVAISESDP